MQAADTENQNSNEFPLLGSESVFFVFFLLLSPTFSLPSCFTFVLGKINRPREMSLGLTVAFFNLLLI